MKVFALDNWTQGSVVDRVLVEMLKSDPAIVVRVAARLEQLRDD